jgi:hypothetical protein
LSCVGWVKERNPCSNHNVLKAILKGLKTAFVFPS